MIRSCLPSHAMTNCWTRVTWKAASFGARPCPHCGRCPDEVDEFNRCAVRATSDGRADGDGGDQTDHRCGDPGVGQPALFDVDHRSAPMRAGRIAPSKPSRAGCQVAPRSSDQSATVVAPVHP